MAQGRQLRGAAWSRLGCPALPCAAAPVDVAVEHHLAKHPQLSGLVGRLQGDVGGIPVCPDAIPAAVQGRSTDVCIQCE